MKSYQSQGSVSLLGLTGLLLLLSLFPPHSGLSAARNDHRDVTRYVRGIRNLWDEAITISSTGDLEVERRTPLADNLYRAASVDRERLIEIIPRDNGGPPEVVAYEFVRWGSREYLIEPREMLSFASAINAGFEPRSTAAGDFLLREGDWELPIAGSPEIGEAWQRYILRSELQGEITFGPREDRTLGVSLGSVSGLRPGMSLYLVHRPEAARAPSESPTSRVDEGSSDHFRVTVLQVGNECSVVGFLSAEKRGNKFNPDDFVVRSRVVEK